MIRRYTYKRRSRKGMAMLVVLFIVMVIAVISSGFIARSDASLQSGRNYCQHNEVKYLAWGGMEHAWALVQEPNSITSLPFELTAQQLDNGSDHYYDLTIETPAPVAAVADPNNTAYVYPVECTGYKQVSGQSKASSTLSGNLYYDPSDSTYYISIEQ